MQIHQLPPHHTHTYKYCEISTLIYLLAPQRSRQTLPPAYLMLFSETPLLFHSTESDPNYALRLNSNPIFPAHSCGTGTSLLSTAHKGDSLAREQFPSSKHAPKHKLVNTKKAEACYGSHIRVGVWLEKRALILAQAMSFSRCETWNQSQTSWNILIHTC